MSAEDPKRLSEGGGALAEMIAAGQEELPADHQIGALALKLGIAGGLGGAGGAAAAAKAGAGAAAKASAGAASAGAAGAGAAGAAGAGAGVAVGAAKVGLAMKIGAAVALVGAVSVGTVAVTSSPRPAPTGLVATTSPPPPEATPSAPRARGTDLAPPPSAEPIVSAPSASAPAPRVSAPSPRASASAPVIDEGPEAEVKLLERAQDALRGRPAEALALSQEHARRFPRGMLGQEREVIAIEALAKLGRTDEARARADRFRARFPGSSHARRIDAILGR